MRVRCERGDTAKNRELAGWCNPDRPGFNLRRSDSKEGALLATHSGAALKSRRNATLRWWRERLRRHTPARCAHANRASTSGGAASTRRAGR